MAGVLLSGCSATRKPSALEAALADAAKKMVFPVEVRGLRNPLSPSLQSINRGRHIYQQYCSFCHDADGRSSTWIGQAVYPPAADLNSAHVQDCTDEELVWIIQHGVRFTGMPAWNSTHSEMDTWELVYFLRTFRYRTPKSQTFDSDHFE